MRVGAASKKILDKKELLRKKKGASKTPNARLHGTGSRMKTKDRVTFGGGRTSNVYPGTEPDWRLWANGKGGTKKSGGKGKINSVNQTVKHS